MPPNATKERLVDEDVRFDLRRPASSQKDLRACARDSRKRASDVLDKMQATVASEIQAWKKHRASGSTLENAGVLRAEDCTELEKEILQEYEKLQGQVESSFHNIRVKTEGKLLFPHQEQQTAELLERDQELESRLKEKEDRVRAIDVELSKTIGEVASLRETLGQKELKISELESKFLEAVGVFGASAWNKYFGDVGEEPPLPPDIVEAMKSRCPFWREKQTRETHLLLLIPASVNDQPFSLDLLKTLMQTAPETGQNETSFRDYDSHSYVKEKFGSKSMKISYWILITREILPYSTNKIYSEQTALISSRGQERTGMLDYRPPSTLEATTAVMTNFMRTGERLLCSDQTRCRDRIDGSYRTCVGYFGTRDTIQLSLYHNVAYNSNTIGVLACCALKQD